MQWTVNFFRHQSNTWGNRQESSNSGARAYAARKNTMWGDMASSAEQIFKTLIITWQWQTRLIFLFCANGFLLIIMSSKSIRIFNPFDLRPPPYSEDKWMAQEVIFYCESWFQCALRQMCLTSQDNLRWMKGCLRSELVGLTYALGNLFVDFLVSNLRYHTSAWPRLWVELLMFP